nr:DUF1799 domain-containing protein [Bowmanella dokdonensis]
MAFRAFCAAETQWMLNSKDQRYALDYHRAEVCWSKLGLVVAGKDFEKVQALEKVCREAV